MPEIPRDTPEDNPLLRTGTVPKFGALTAINCANGVGKRTIEYESGLCRIEENLRGTLSSAGKIGQTGMLLNTFF